MSESPKVTVVKSVPASTRPEKGSATVAPQSVRDSGKVRVGAGLMRF
jgi:hypothetical protein